jgi:hypothetical protein
MLVSSPLPPPLATGATRAFSLMAASVFRLFAFGE